MSNKTYSVKDIAEMAGVSVATVSRVINQNGRFSKETEDRVNKVIAMCNYKPNQLARGLRTSKARMIGILVPDISNEFFSKITLALQTHLYALNYATIIMNTNEDAEIEANQLNMLNSQKVSGLIYISGNVGGSETPEVPAVYIDRQPSFGQEHNNYIFIESDNYQGGILATQALIDKGCNRIACVSYAKNVSSHRQRVEGYAAALKQNGFAVKNEHIVIAGEISADSGRRVTKELLQAHKEIDGIFFTADVLAVGALKAINELGLSIPGQLKIVGFDDIALSRLTIPSLTTIHQDIERFGLLAANALVSMIDGQPLEQKQHTIPVRLVTRKST